MQVTPSGYTIAQFCQLMEQTTIKVNRDYQRTAQAWPLAARSYLIDTVLSGYPMPKISLYQKTDVKKRSTFMEIVDGQQRSQAISDFFKGTLRLSGNTQWAGKTYAQLSEEDQGKFLNYHITTDIFVGATDNDIRQMFKRINSYTVPLNDAEKRHASFQGEFKWFIVELTDRYAQALKDMGVLSEKQLGRMQDAALFTEIARALLHGIETSAKAKLEAVYRDNDPEFKEGKKMNKQIDAAMGRVFKFKAAHKTSLMKPFNFYSLLLGICHVEGPVSPLQTIIHTKGDGIKDFAKAEISLTTLAAAVDQPDAYPDLKKFTDACAQATNTLANRATRLKWICKALQGNKLT